MAAKADPAALGSAAGVDDRIADRRGGRNNIAPDAAPAAFNAADLARLLLTEKLRPPGGYCWEFRFVGGQLEVTAHLLVEAPTFCTRGVA